VSKHFETVIAREMGAETTTIHPLSGGCIGEVYRVGLADGRSVVVKVDGGAKPRLDIEGYMLRYLQSNSSLPVPEVLWSDQALLIMSYITGDSHFSGACQAHAAALLGDLHRVRGPAFGLERDTLIGGLHQPNPWTNSWIDFFRDQRLLHMARAARSEAVMPPKLLSRIEAFAADLDKFLEEPEYPALLHGDVWTTNVLADREKITGFIDPAVYYGHPEIELAFITLFSTFGPPFFEAYEAASGIRPGFFELRRDLYNLYPLLVHARLFGASYLGSVERTISALGY